MGVTLAGATLIGAAGGLKSALSGPGAFKNLEPGKPSIPAPPLMPDQNSILQSQQLEEAKAAALRTGRASTVLSQGPSGNTGDKLGP